MVCAEAARRPTISTSHSNPPSKPRALMLHYHWLLHLREPSSWAELGISRPASASSRPVPWLLGGRLMSCGWPARRLFGCRRIATRLSRCIRFTVRICVFDLFSCRKNAPSLPRDLLVYAVGPQPSWLPRLQTPFLDFPKALERQNRRAHATCNSAHWLWVSPSRVRGFGHT